MLIRIENFINNWLAKEEPSSDIPISNFYALANEMKLADVILVEGRSRISQVIKLITLSQWSHSALYVGSLSELKDELHKLSGSSMENSALSPELQEALEAAGYMVSDKKAVK